MKSFRRLLSVTLPFRRGMALATLLGVLTIASSVGLMMTSAWMIAKAGLQPSIAELGVAVVSVRFFGIARGIFRYGERLVSHDTTFRLLAQFRVRFYEAIEPLAPARLGGFRSGDLLSRVVEDVESLQNVYLRVVAPPLVALIIALLLTLLFAAFDPLVALVALVFMLAAGVGAPLLTWMIEHRAGAGRQRVALRAELDAALLDDLQGIGETLVYGQSAARLKELETLTRQLSAVETRLAWTDSAQTALMILLTHGAALAVLAVAIPRVEPIFLAALALGTTAAFEAFMPLSQAANQLGANAAAAGRLFEIADLPPLTENWTDLARSTWPPASFDIRLTDVTFAYDPAYPPALKNLTLTIPHGKKIAIVGASGSGKSTLVSLLARLDDPSSGVIILSGLDIHTYSEEDVRGAVAVMEQRTHLFNTTLRENIWIGRRAAPAESVVEAARHANLHEFVMSLPDGYEAVVGENGVRLSAGERQRVALARVLLKDVPILVLDEPTANLDAANERAILETILAQAEGRTLILLTHRLALLDRMDEVVVLNHGQVVERGTHAELLARGGVYSRLSGAQAGRVP